MSDIQRLEPLVGDWSVEVPAFPDLAGSARMSIEWALGGAFLLQRSSAPDPFPDGLCVIAASGDGYTQHYFDSRGVVRLYAMTFDGRNWTLERHEPDFSPLPFHQRFLGTLDGDRITARFDRSDDGESWELDFEVIYRRL